MNLEPEPIEPMEEGQGSSDETFAAETNAEPGGEWRTTAGYTSSMERCATCDYFQPEAGMCDKYKGEAEEGGHCKSWEAMDAGGAAEESQEEEGDDLVELEELA